MKIMLATLALNEMEHLPSLYEQHKDWPDLLSWVFVEAADTVYARTSPDMVSAEGLSVDGTSEFLRDLAARDSRVRYVPHGFCGHDDPAQGKCAARNRYLEIAEEVQPTHFFVLDADEFYCKDHQKEINLRMTEEAYSSWIFGLRTIWRPPALQDKPLFRLEAKGCLFSVPICRGWRWTPGVRYRRNHNTPEDVSGDSLLARVRRFSDPGTPYCVHMGFTSSLRTRQAKHRYYEARGEGQTDHRKRYVDCRRAFERAKEGMLLPHGARVTKYDGIIPEVFRTGGER